MIRPLGLERKELPERGIAEFRRTSSNACLCRQTWTGPSQSPLSQDWRRRQSITKCWKIIIAHGKNFFGEKFDVRGHESKYYGYLRDAILKIFCSSRKNFSGKFCQNLRISLFHTNFLMIGPNDFKVNCYIWVLLGSMCPSVGEFVPPKVASHKALESWKSMGFLHFPNCIYDEYRVKMLEWLKISGPICVKIEILKFWQNFPLKFFRLE